jgi:hypothetical protein
MCVCLFGKCTQTRADWSLVPCLERGQIESSVMGILSTIASTPLHLYVRAPCRCSRLYSLRSVNRMWQIFVGRTVPPLTLRANLNAASDFLNSSFSLQVFLLATVGVVNVLGARTDIRIMNAMKRAERTEAMRAAVASSRTSTAPKNPQALPPVKSWVPPGGKTATDEVAVTADPISTPPRQPPA